MGADWDGLRRTGMQHLGSSAQHSLLVLFKMEGRWGRKRRE